MKKEYIAPQIEVYRLQVQGQLLDYSGDYNNGSLGARKFDGGWEDEDWDK